MQLLHQTAKRNIKKKIAGKDLVWISSRIKAVCGQTRGEQMNIKNTQS